jgi:membrane protease subunit (stomatin/prohibitin family)
LENLSLARTCASERFFSKIKNQKSKHVILSEAKELKNQKSVNIMGLFNKNPNEAAFAGGKKNWADVIKNSGGDSHLIWRQPEEDFNNNSTLIVMPGEEAIFIKDGVIEQVFENGKYQMTTENYPFLSRLRNAFTGGISTFNCVVYFVRKAHSQEILWGCSVQVKDPVHEFATSVKGFGAYKVQVERPVVLLEKLLGSNADLTQDGIKKYFNNNFSESITDAIGTTLKQKDKEEKEREEIMEFCSNKKEISGKIFLFLEPVLDNYGIKLIDFAISNLEVPMDDPSRIKLEEIRVKKSEFRQLGDDWQRQQQVEIMKTMAANEGGGLASAGAGLGMGVGMAGMFGGMTQQMMQPQQPQQQMHSAPPPPPPAMAFHVLLNGTQQGPFDMASLGQMAQNGQLTRETMVWKAGMPQWAKAAECPELTALFGAVPPPPPPAI